ncbi:MAG: hypothetical protein U0984_03055 [Prosthecobacter sp.]|nr:hypothetical protein [Prosthecobacter sp.]
MAWTPPPLDPTPYGIELATRIATCLEGGHEFGYGHRDYCGMGLALQEGHYCYDEVNDGRLPMLEDILRPGNTDGRAFANRDDFIAWLAVQSDKSLARLDAPNEFYHRNQTVDRNRLEEFARIREAVPHVSLSRWSRLWQSIPAKAEEAPSWYRYVFASYAEPQRHYHTLRHLNECLIEFDSVRHLAKQPAALEAALWLHDIVYHPEESDNEEGSARLANDILSDGEAPKAFIQQVRALILVTKNHTPDATPDSDLMCDIDLAILGQNQERFFEYEAAIREEYADVPIETYAPKRTQILEGFLKRPSIYANDHFRGLYEATARENLKTSIRLVAEAAAPPKRKWFGLR